ncbi:MAG: hypothetical protein K2N35_10425 [Muribaculaceae bacterium]|nr:hypothetical protein [Muribaculaceae bacterium]
MSEKIDNFAKNLMFNQKTLMQAEKDTPEQEPIIDRKAGFIEYVENLDSDELSEMLGSRAIPSMIHSIRRHGISDFSDTAVRLWTVDMLLEGMKGSTVKRYTGAIHTLYKEWVKTVEDSDKVNDPFNFSLAEFDIESSSKKLKEIEDNLAAAERLTKLSLKQDSQAYVYNKAFQYLLFDPFASLKDIVNMKFSDDHIKCLHIEDIVLSMRNAPQAKYVFPLQQGKRREPAIIKDLLIVLHSTAQRAGLKFGDSFSRDSITSLWIAAALREGIPYGEIHEMIANLPEAYSFLTLIDPVEVSDSKKIENLNIVAYSITNKNPGWFVLRMRNGVTPEKIKVRLKDKESPLQQQIQYYYPTRSIKKLEKKKMITVEAPVLPGLLFVRLPYDQVSPLISVIGDLAWCYRATANTSSPYSVIPQAEMRIFQRSVGKFTDDIEMDIISELPALDVGDEVMIENGTHLDGQVATIRKVRSVDGTLTFTLRLSDTAYIKWKDVDLPASHLKKV